MANQQETEIIFLSSPKAREELQDVVDLGKIKQFPAKIEEIKEWFKGFKVETVELWIQGAVKEGNLLKLIVSFEAEAGCKVTLKPV